MSPLLISCLIYPDAHLGAVILVSDFGTADPFYSPELAPNTSLTLTKYLGCASDTSTLLSDADVIGVQGIPAGNLALASCDLGISWGIVVDEDYIPNDITNSIRDGVLRSRPHLLVNHQMRLLLLPPQCAVPNPGRQGSERDGAPSLRDRQKREECPVRC